jgi:pimeloyl-ACP methyl ester carboxylesterase
MALFVFGGCNLSRQLLYHPQKITHARLSHIRDHFPQVFEIKINTHDGHRLHGWLLRKDLDLLPTIIYFGGNGEEVSYNLEFFADKVSANALLLNYRSYGLSTGSPSEKKLKSDAGLIYNHLLDHYNLKPKQIIPMGRSLGSGIALFLAAQKKLQRVILVTPYDSIREVAYDYFPNFLVRWSLSDTYETQELCRQFQGQMLVLAAAQDRVIHPSHAQKLCAGHPQKEFVMLEQVGHNNIHNHKKYWQVLRDFL